MKRHVQSGHPRWSRSAAGRSWTHRAAWISGLALSLALTLLPGWLGIGANAQAASDQAGVTADQVRVVRLGAQRASPASQDRSIQFHAVVQYDVHAAPGGFLLLFVFEDDATTATSASSTGAWVVPGRGLAELTTGYQLHPGVRTVRLIAALFKDESTLLAWGATRPLSFTPFPGRMEFGQAIAERASGNLGKAVEHLTSAIDLERENGYYYCWRADTKLRLHQYDAAVADYNRALDLLPANRACRLGRGVALVWDGQDGRAISDLTSVIDTSADPDLLTAAALRARGVAFAALGKPSQAIADYEAYLSLLPRATDRAKVLGWINALSVAA